MIALLVIIVAFGVSVVWVLHSTLTQRADAMRLRWEEWSIDTARRAEIYELQRASIETRLAAIETRITLLTPTVSDRESLREAADDKQYAARVIR